MTRRLAIIFVVVVVGRIPCCSSHKTAQTHWVANVSDSLDEMKTSSTTLLSDSIDSTLRGKTEKLKTDCAFWQDQLRNVWLPAGAEIPRQFDGITKPYVQAVNDFNTAMTLCLRAGTLPSTYIYGGLSVGSQARMFLAPYCLPPPPQQFHGACRYDVPDNAMR